MKKPSLQCCQTINQISNRLHMKVSTHYLHSQINWDGKYNMKFMLFIWFSYHLLVTYAPCCHVILKGAKFEILPKCLNLSWMEDFNVNYFCILMGRPKIHQLCTSNTYGAFLGCVLGLPVVQWMMNEIGQACRVTKGLSPARSPSLQSPRRVAPAVHSRLPAP